MNHLSAIRCPFIIDEPPQVAVLRDTTREENPDARLEPVGQFFSYTHRLRSGSMTAGRSGIEEACAIAAHPASKYAVALRSASVMITGVKQQFYQVHAAAMPTAESV